MMNRRGFLGAIAAALPFAAAAKPVRAQPLHLRASATKADAAPFIPHDMRQALSAHGVLVDEGPPRPVQWESINLGRDSDGKVNISLAGRLRGLDP